MPLDAPAAQTPSAPKPPPTGTSRAKRYLFIAASAVGLLLLVFLLGYFRGRGEFSAVDLKNRSLTTELTASKVAAAKALDAERARTQLLEARRCLDQAVAALDYRNFGTAQQRLKEAAQKIVAARADGRLLDLGKALEAYRLVATEDLGSQRQKLVSYLTEFDQLYPAR